MALGTLGFVLARRLLGLTGLGPAPGAKDVEIAGVAPPRSAGLVSPGRTVSRWRCWPGCCPATGGQRSQCELGIYAPGWYSFEQAAEDGSAPDLSGWSGRSRLVGSRRGEAAPSVRPLAVVVPALPVEYVLELAFTEDQHAVGEFAKDEPLGVGVRPGHRGGIFGA